jgi:hypothetical protein
VAITDWPQMDQLSNNIADDMNAEKLPIVPTTSFTKPSVLVPVRHSAGRPHTGRLAKRCDALVPEGLRLAPDRVIRPPCTVTRSGWLATIQAVDHACLI